MIKVVAAIIKSGNKFMICQRPRGKSRALLWEFPGGKVEKGETEELALIRECREELGVIIEPKEKFITVTHKYPDIEIELSVYIAIIKSGEPKMIEHADIKWIEKSEIDNFEFCPADKDVLEKIKKELEKPAL